MKLCDINQDGKVEYQEYLYFVVTSLERSGLDLYDWPAEYLLSLNICICNRILFINYGLYFMMENYQAFGSSSPVWSL